MPGQLTLPRIQRVLAHPEPLGNLCYTIPALGNLGHRIALELITEIGLSHHRLLSSKIGKKASTNLGAIHFFIEAQVLEQGVCFGQAPLTSNERTEANRLFPEPALME